MTQALGHVVQNECVIELKYSHGKQCKGHLCSIIMGLGASLFVSENGTEPLLEMIQEQHECHPLWNQCESPMECSTYDPKLRGKKSELGSGAPVAANL